MNPTTKDTAADREIVITRWLNAPRELVFAAWTDPAHVGEWWGPKGFTNTVSEMDVRPGGHWRITMHGPDGTDYPNHIVFTEVVKPALLAYKHGTDGRLEDAFDVTITFEAHGARTLLTMRSLFASAAERDHVETEYGALEGAQQMVDRFAAHLLGEQPEREIVSLRVIPLPREQVYAAFTDPQRLARFWGPNGFRSSFEEFDPRPGGHWRFVMHGPDGTNYPNHSVFTELTPPERIVFEHVSHENFQMAMSFEERGPAETLLIWRMRFETAHVRAAVAPIVVNANEETSTASPPSSPSHPPVEATTEATMKTLLLPLIFFAAGAASAAPATYTIDPMHTFPSFEADHMGLSVWRGKFNKNAGTVTLDKAAGQGRVELTIDVASIDFGLDIMNSKALEPDLFDTAKYPTARYTGRLDGFANGAPSRVVGELTLHGVTKPVTLAINSFKCMPHPMLKRDWCGADAQATINRADFGIDAGRDYGFKMEVVLRIQVEAVLAE